ncbi:MAG: glycosyltransferase subfamily GT2 protein [Bacteroidota bacterium]|nr:glycosyltransferase subfamily GT2 protein [Bacteroidota bacterium]
MIKGRIGVGVITFNRLPLFINCINSIPPVERLVVVNDGEPYPESSYPQIITKIIQHRKNKGVGISKNDALRYLLDEECEHIFLCEDDIKIKNINVFNNYIRIAENASLPHLNYGLHGPANKTVTGTPNPRKVIKVSPRDRVVFYQYPVGAFSYYHRSIIEKIGLMDEFYKNFHEHVDHTLKIIKAGYHPPYGWFADIENSDDFIEDLDPNLSYSRHRKPHWYFLLRNYGFFVYYTIKNGIRREGTEEEFNNFIRLILARRI